MCPHSFAIDDMEVCELLRAGVLHGEGSSRSGERLGSPGKGSDFLFCVWDKMGLKWDTSPWSRIESGVGECSGVKPGFSVIGMHVIP